MDNVLMRARTRCIGSSSRNSTMKLRWLRRGLMMSLRTSSRYVVDAGILESVLVDKKVRVSFD